MKVDVGRPAQAGLEDELRELASRGARRVRAQHLARGWAESIATAAPLLAVVPVLHAVQQGVRWLGGEGKLATGWLELAAWTLAVPSLYIVGRTLLTGLRAVDRRDALAWIDRTLESNDRLLIADEFLALSERGPFHEAALADAERHARALRDRVFPRTEPSAHERSRVSWPWWLAAAAAVALLAWLDWSSRARRGTETELAGISDMLVRDAERAREEPPPTQEGVEEPPGRDRERLAASAASAPNQERAHSSELADWMKESEGKTGSGRSSQAESASAKSHSRGAPSNQGQISKGRPKAPNAAEQEPKKKPAVDAQAPPKKEAQEESGSTAGRGSSRGSNKNPAASDWASKDQVSSPDDEEIEQDEETEDEDEEQESRGGIQPHLRDRKPPVSRDLQIGFGNRSNPDANGRGGPGEQKKSRGTASLVLGVPIPDRIKGQPNAGKTKITQERIEPRPEESEPSAASERSPRSEPFGVVPHAELDPWMRALVRTYFLSLRNPSTD